MNPLAKTKVNKVRSRFSISYIFSLYFFVRKNIVFLFSSHIFISPIYPRFIKSFLSFQVAIHCFPHLPLVKAAKIVTEIFGIYPNKCSNRTKFCVPSKWICWNGSPKFLTQRIEVSIDYAKFTIITKFIYFCFTQYAYLHSITVNHWNNCACIRSSFWLFLKIAHIFSEIMTSKAFFVVMS